MIGFLYRNALMPFFEKVIKGRKTFRYWSELETTQWLSRTELETLQLNSLRQLLTHALNHCPYFREEWTRLGLNPSQIHTITDFQQWPLITKDTIRANRPRMRADLPNLRMLSKATGGSSGVPLQFDLTMESHERRTAATFRGYSWAGALPGTRQLFFWGVPLGQRSRWKRYKEYFFETINRRKVLNSFEFRREKTPEFLKQLNRYRPDVIVAYTNPLYAFARSLDESQLKPYSPKSIIVGAEKIYPFQRALIEKVFQAPVFETYGAREFMLIGAECEKHTGLHLTFENLVVEVVDDRGNPTPFGQEGDVCITDLTNYGMPFIRYLNGDRAVAGWTECTCGRGLPMLQKVTGRQLDLVETPDGRIVPGEFFPHLIKDFPAIERFQVIQDALDHIQLSVVVLPSWNSSIKEALEGEMRKIIGSEIRLDIKEVDDIPLTGTGKLRVVVRELPSSSSHQQEVYHDTPTAS